MEHSRGFFSLVCTSLRRGDRQTDILELSRKLGIPTPAEGDATDEFFYGNETVRIPPHCPNTRWWLFLVVLWVLALMLSLLLLMSPLWLLLLLWMVGLLLLVSLGCVSSP